MPKEHEHSAYRFHTDLFLSGLERIILASSPFNHLLIQVKTLCRSHEKHQRHITQTSTLN